MNSFTFQYTCMHPHSLNILGQKSRWHLPSLSVATFYSVWSNPQYKTFSFCSPPYLTDFEWELIVLTFKAEPSKYCHNRAAVSATKLKRPGWLKGGCYDERVSFQIRKFDKSDVNNHQMSNVGVARIDLFRPAHLTPGRRFFATFSPSKNPPHLTSGRLFFATFLLSRVRPSHICLVAAQITCSACSTILWRSLKRWNSIKWLNDQIRQSCV